MEIRNEENFKAGFKACGIYPINPEAVLKKMPAEELQGVVSSRDNSECKLPPPKSFISSALQEYLQQFRYDPDRKKAEPAPKKERNCLKTRSRSSSEQNC